MSSAKDFQRATIERIAEIFRGAVKDGSEQRRVLLADEVGLGKTIVARGVIDKVRELRRDVNDDMFRVVYVCSNLNIIKQNMTHLGVKDEDILNIAESRLSMQHLTLAMKKRELEESGHYGPGQMPEVLLPLTPGTSFNIGNSCGTMAERALLYGILSKMDAFKGCASCLESFFRLKMSPEKWDGLVKDYDKKINRCGSEYLETMKRAFEAQSEFSEFKKCILAQCEAATTDWHEVRKCILMARRISAHISIGMLDPDLVVMDEFQRFSSLLRDANDDEQSMITRAFFGNEGETQPLILLLSATPYKPYTTLEELNENNCDDHYEDFKSLMDFLLKGNRAGQFTKVWSEYGRALAQLSTENWTVLIAAKDDAEKLLYGTMCRTERPNAGLIKARQENLEIDEGDILSYAHMQQVLDDCHKLREENPRVKGIMLPMRHMPVDYVKSSPYLLSFMDRYELKQRIMNVYSTLSEKTGDDVRLPVSQRRQTYLLREESLKAFAPIAPNNARLRLLTDEVLSNHAERLLWIPASHPYYSTPASNVFERNRGFSKMLVFSAWEMVPRMIATLLSYEMERRTVKLAFGKEQSSGAMDGIDRYSLKNWSFAIASVDSSLICYASKTLAKVYSPQEFYGQSIDAVRKILNGRIKELIVAQRPDVVFEGSRCNEPLVLKVCRALDRQPDAEELPDRISEDVVKVMVNASIGSPAVCAYRILHDAGKAVKVAEGFRTLFARRTSVAILELIYARRSQDYYYEQILDYCVMGNLQSVLDEFAYMLASDNKDVDTGICDAMVSRDVSIEVDTTSSFVWGADTNRKKFSLRAHYALPFNQAKFDEKNVARSNSVRQAFNSPFRPFVLASTSAGQEGLDFHWYCRKVLHWNLPTNPQDVEQREGRINRYQSFAIRRNIARLYPVNFEWSAMFAAAEKDLRTRYPSYNDMVPYWCLPPELIAEKGEDLEMIERIVPLYPLSVDSERYDRLIKVLSLYRLTMGQPRQEELLQMLDGRVDKGQIENLLFDLSPFSHLKKSMQDYVP